MSLVVSVLENDLLALFKEMYKDSKNGNRALSQGIANAVKKYIESGTAITADVGVITGSVIPPYVSPPGNFTGVGNGSIKVEAKLCEDIIFIACEVMNNMQELANEYFAREIANGIDTMVSAGVIDTQVTGTVITQAGASVPAAGKAKGNITCQKVMIETQLLQAFFAMEKMATGGDEYLAKIMATSIDSYTRSGVVSTNGLFNLVGSIGVGNLT